MRDLKHEARLRGRKRDIIIDADDTIVPFYEPFTRFALDHDYDLEEANIYSLEELLPHLSGEELGSHIAEFHLTTPHTELAPLPGAYAACEYLDKIHDIWIITARDESVSDVLRGWVRHYGFDRFIPEERIIHATTDNFTNRRSKLEVALEHGLEIQRVIEDKPKAAYEFVEAGILTYIIPQPWNVNCERGFYRPKHRDNAWYEIGIQILGDFEDRRSSDESTLKIAHRP